MLGLSLTDGEYSDIADHILQHILDRRDENGRRPQRLLFRIKHGARPSLYAKYCADERVKHLFAEELKFVKRVQHMAVHSKLLKQISQHMSLYATRMKYDTLASYLHEKSLELVDESAHLTPEEALHYVKDRLIVSVDLSKMGFESLHSIVTGYKEKQHLWTRVSVFMAVSRVFGLFHKAGVYHGDAHMGNILVRLSKHTVEVAIIDFSESRIATGKKGPVDMQNVKAHRDSLVPPIPFTYANFMYTTFVPMIVHDFALMRSLDQRDPSGLSDLTKAFVNVAFLRGDLHVADNGRQHPDVLDHENRLMTDLTTHWPVKMQNVQTMVFPGKESSDVYYIVRACNSMEMSSPNMRLFFHEIRMAVWLSTIPEMKGMVLPYCPLSILDVNYVRYTQGLYQHLPIPELLGPMFVVAYKVDRATVVAIQKGVFSFHDQNEAHRKRTLGEGAMKSEYFVELVQKLNKFCAFAVDIDETVHHVTYDDKAKACRWFNMGNLFPKVDVYGNEHFLMDYRDLIIGRRPLFNFDNIREEDIVEWLRGESEDPDGTMQKSKPKKTASKARIKYFGEPEDADKDDEVAPDALVANLDTLLNARSDRFKELMIARGNMEHAVKHIQSLVKLMKPPNAIPKSQVAHAFKQLQNKGFIDNTMKVPTNITRQMLRSIIEKKREAYKRKFKQEMVHFHAHAKALVQRDPSIREELRRRLENIDFSNFLPMRSHAAMFKLLDAESTDELETKSVEEWSRAQRAVNMYRIAVSGDDDPYMETKLVNDRLRHLRDQADTMRGKMLKRKMTIRRDDRDEAAYALLIRNKAEEALPKQHSNFGPAKFSPKMIYSQIRQARDDVMQEYGAMPQTLADFMDAIEEVFAGTSFLDKRHKGQTIREAITSSAKMVSPKVDSRYKLNAQLRKASKREASMPQGTQKWKAPKRRIPMRMR